MDHSHQEQGAQELPGGGILYNTGNPREYLSSDVSTLHHEVELFGTAAHTSDYIGAGLIVLAVLAIAVEDSVLKRLRHRLPYI